MYAPGVFCRTVRDVRSIACNCPLGTFNVRPKRDTMCCSSYGVPACWYLSRNSSKHLTSSKMKCLLLAGDSYKGAKGEGRTSRRRCTTACHSIKEAFGLQRQSPTCDDSPGLVDAHVRQLWEGNRRRQKCRTVGRSWKTPQSYVTSIRTVECFDRFPIA